MINHARTLLLNQSATIAGPASGVQNAELIDINFMPLQLPQALQVVRDTYIPSNYTIYQQNAVMAWLMRLLHSADLTPYTLVIDPRYTYDLDNDFTVAINRAAIQVDKWRADNCSVDLVYIYQPISAWAGDNNIMTWVFQRISPSVLSIQFTQRPVQNYSVVFKSGTTPIASLLDPILSYRLTSSTNMLDGDFRFILTYYPQLMFSLPALLTRLSLVQSKAGIVFDPWGPYASQITELKNLWYQSTEAPVRAGAFLLAYMLQCERLRQGLPLRTNVS